MRLVRNFTRWASPALAILLLASSLTCLTAACRTLCAPQAAADALASAGAVPEAGLPPCHRGPTPQGVEGEVPAPPAGGCDAGSPCCAQWLNDHATLRLADPATLRTLLPATDAGAAALAVVVPTPFAADPPDPGALATADPSPPSARSRAAFGTRGPPPVAPAA